MGTDTFLPEPAELSAEGQALYDEDVADEGYVMNLSRMWAHDAATSDKLFDLLAHVAEVGGLSFRDRGILVLSTASTLGDGYCSLAWGKKIATTYDADLAAAILAGKDDVLDERERALAAWARKIASDPNATTADDVQALRDVGYDDRQILALTTYAALRLAFSTVNDALGARPDAQMRDSVPQQVRDTVTWGRPIADA